MAELKDKSVLILEQEEQFSITLAAQVMDKPRLSLWMILIPIFFIYYFNDLNKYKNGCRQFVEHYIIDKKRAMNEAVEVVTSGREIDIPALADLSNMSSKAREKQAQVLAVLVEHYIILLNARGEDYPSLIRNAYGTLTDYLLFLNHLNQAEKEVNKALTPDLRKSHEGINDIVSRMEDVSARLRRETAESIFQ
jgi:hypothetical protein